MTPERPAWARGALRRPGRAMVIEMLVGAERFDVVEFAEACLEVFADPPERLCAQRQAQRRLIAFDGSVSRPASVIA